MIDYTNPIFDRLQDCWDPASEQQLRDLESKLEMELPDDFKQFLRVFNAGYWRHDVWFRLSNCAPRWDQLHIHANLGIVLDEWAWDQDIWGVKDSYEDRIPTTFIPIMRSGIELIGLHRAAEHASGVSLWDHTFDENDECNIVPIADSFSSFVESLLPVDESEFIYELLPAFQAVERGDGLGMRRYLEDGGKIDLRNASGWTLLMCAARKCWPKVVALLLEAGADPNTRDSAGWSPLHHATCSGSLDSVKLLLAAGADVHYRDARARNLEEIAKQEYQHRLKRFFKPLMQ